MVKTEGTDSKRRKKTVDAGVLYAQQNVRVTRSNASNKQDQLERRDTVISLRQTSNTALELEPVYVDAAATDDDMIKGTKGVASNTPKLSAAKRCVQTKDASSPNRDKQPKHEPVDENISTRDQGLCPSRNSNPSKLQKEFDEFERRLNKFERCLLRHCKEDDGGLQPRPLTSPSKQKKDFDGFGRRTLKLCEKDDNGLQSRPSTLPSSSTQHVEKVLPSTVEKTGLLKAQSLNLTAMMEGHGSPNDDDQAESPLDLALTNVKGYHVKTEVAPTLERILEKYHDIARGCIIKNPKVVVLMLEMLCSFCQKFDNTGLKDISEREIEYLTSFVENFQQVGFDVKWLIERLKDISEIKRILIVYPTLKDEKLKRQMKEEEVDMLKQKLSVAEAELAMMKAAEDGEKYRNFHQQIDAFKGKGLAFWGTSVFYGLL